MSNANGASLASAFDSTTFSEDVHFHLDKPVGSMSISPCGRDVVLASRQGLHIIDLDSPYAPPRHLPHHTPWEVADVQWSPFAARDFWVVSTSNQKALVWNLAMSTSQGPIEHVLHAHSRAITDINFSAHHPDILATCAVDSFVHCWDLRHPNKPALTFCDWFAGATQVKWSRQDSHVVASSHDKVLRIWDDRKGAHPLHSIEAHSTKIYGLDWNRTCSTSVVTCSLDKTIKFWDFSLDLENPQHIIKTPFPVWRARHTPFGSGILAMPKRGNHNLHLYSQKPGKSPEESEVSHSMHQFTGHQDQVKEFLWRSRGPVDNERDARDFQLVTWGADRMLYLHRVDEKILKNVDFVKGNPVNHKLNFTRRNAMYKTFREEPVKPSYPSQIRVSSAHSVSRGSTNGSSYGQVRSIVESRIRVAGFNTWADDTFMSSRLNSSTAEVMAQRDVDPITWMKGVKIGKKDSDLAESATSLLSPELTAKRSWETFDSLGEEITHVADLFSRVVFDKIDVQRRFVKISLSGPWGPEGETIYLNCEIKFPIHYPASDAPRLHVEKTTALESSRIVQLEHNVKAVGDAYLTHHISSLEAIIRYLQGERTLESLTAWTQEQKDLDLFEVPPEMVDSSSDEEDSGIAGYRPQTGDSLFTSSELMGASNANVPLPKACGALWADDGSLVCFFPPKPTATKSLASSLGIHDTALAVRGHTNNSTGFGKWQFRTALGSKYGPSLETVKSSDSEDEATSDAYSSSASSLSSQEAGSPIHRSIHPYAWRNRHLNQPRIVGSAMDGSANSSGNVKAGDSGREIPKNIVSIQRHDDLLPVNRVLAEGYLTSGGDACRHNEKLASSHGTRDAANAWHALESLLRDEVPVQRVCSHYRGTPFLVPAPRRLLHKDSGIDLSHDLESDGTPSKPHLPVEWGQHPLGAQGLVNELFLHFEQLGDIQMLAVMASVLGEPRRAPTTAAMSTWLSQHDGQSSQAMGVKSSHSEIRLMRYYPSKAVGLSILNSASLARSVPSVHAHPSRARTSGASSFSPSNSDPDSSLSAKATPPIEHSLHRQSLERGLLSSQSMSTSPEQLRKTHRSNSNLANTFASLSRPFSFHTSSSNSPPFNQKRGSIPIRKSITTQPEYMVNPSSFFSKSFSNTDDGHSETEQRDNAPKSSSGSRRPHALRIRLKNQDQFDLEGHARVPLLLSRYASRYQGYRDAYAYQLSAWKMWPQKMEVLKFNSAASRISPAQEATVFVSPRARRRKSMTNGAQENTLSVHRICSQCHTTEPHRSNVQSIRCSKCASNTAAPTCAFCAERILGQSCICLACGHGLHSACLAVLVPHFAAHPSEAQCPAGCGCQCAEFTPADFTMEDAGSRRTSAPTAIRESAGERGWGDVAYESLAKNLGAEGKRHVRPKTSQIWRGIERRKSQHG